MVDVLGLLDGLTASGILLSATIFALLSLYKGIKLKAKLLIVAAIGMLFVGAFWSGPSLDFILVTFTGTNITPIEFYAILSYMWVAPALIVSMYLGGSLLIPKKKWLLVGVFIILGIVFEYFLWFQTSESFVITLNLPGQELIDSSFNKSHPTFLLIALFLISVLVFLSIGFLYKAKQATGELRKKFLYLSLGFFIFVVCGALDSLIAPGPILGLIRGVMMTFALWMYLGFKT